MKYKVYYWRNKKGWFLPPDENSGNLGDMLTPLILDYFNVNYEYTYNDDYNMIVVGSIAKLAKPNTVVLGSGFMKFDDQVEPNANYKFVRGPLSKNKILESNATTSDFYGDPAFLLPLFIDESKKTEEVGFVPHWSQYEIFKKSNPNLHIINVWHENCLEVIKNITSCKCIISSSLHGLIIASAYNIPSAWVEFDKLKNGRDKFIDYYESIDLLNVEPSKLDAPTFHNKSLSDYNLNNIIEVFKDI